MIEIEREAGVQWALGRERRCDDDDSVEETRKMLLAAQLLDLASIIR